MSAYLQYICIYNYTTYIYIYIYIYNANIIAGQLPRQPRLACRPGAHRAGGRVCSLLILVMFIYIYIYIYYKLLLVLITSYIYIYIYTYIYIYIYALPGAHRAGGRKSSNDDININNCNNNIE